MNNEDKMHGREASAPDNDPVSKLLGGLKRVEAPGDFDFRLKARIAAFRPAEAAGSWLPATLRLAAPLMLLLLVGGYFAFTSFYSAGEVSVPAVAEIKPPAVPENVPAPVAVVTEPAIDLMVSDSTAVDRRETGDLITPLPAIKRTSRRSRQVGGPSRGGSIDVEPGGGSLDQAGGISREIYPRGLDPNRKLVVTNADVGGGAPLTVKDVLSPIGVEADYSGLHWAVASVKPNSKAERLGLKAGDVIEAINGQPVTGTTAFAGKFTGKSIGVVRDSKPILIDLTH